jgi:tRNA modification GTPase
VAELAADVVVAPATARGRAALAVVRVTGSGGHAVVAAVCQPLRSRPLGPGAPRRVRFVDAEGPFDDGVVVLGVGPATATGEDLAELTCHGSPLIVDRLVAALVGAGARVARPGEFTRRAVLAGRLDLVQAEAVDALIRAASPEGASLAHAAVHGRLRAPVAALRDGLVAAAAELEARLDWPSDELALEDDDAVCARLRGLAVDAAALAGTWARARALVDGCRVALVGAVNAGKSSLFNRLVGRERALVHASPGTTRDVLEVTVDLDGLAVTLLDTAGERETADAVEAAGQALAASLVAEADLLVVVLRARPEGPDAAERAILSRVAGRRHVVVCNGVDRGAWDGPPGALPTSAVTGDGLAALVARVREALAGAPARADEVAVASARQADLLRSVAGLADEAAAALALAGPAVAADLAAAALSELDALTGADTTEDVLDAVFARFCIGK